MALEPRWRERFFLAGGAIVALAIGVGIAQGNLGLGGLVATLGVALALGRVTPARTEALLLAFAVVGYIVGNRGFAQVSLLSHFPLLPAEAVLAVAFPLMVIRAAVQRELPFRRDAVSLAVLVWIVVSAVRFPLDFRDRQFVALRDFALVYYAVFFFVALEIARDPASRRVLMSALTVGFALLVPVFALSQVYQEFFWTRLTVRGVPLIAHKPDLSSAIAAAGLVWFYVRLRRGGPLRWLWGLLFVSNVALIGFAIGRSTMLALTAVAGLLVCAREWRFPAIGAVVGAVGIMVTVAWASFRGTDLAQTKAYSVYEHAVSIVDWSGARTYRNYETGDASDNNQFRLIWWRTLLDQTLARSPLLGLGWGADLAEGFVQRYYGLGSDDFSARSPHNVLMTIFARSGALGLGAFLFVMVAIGRQTLRALLRHRATGDALPPLGLWCSAWVLLICACFGVVLEGPMGAVVFWALLGLAQASSAVESPPATASPRAASP